MRKRIANNVLADTCPNIHNSYFSRLYDNADDERWDAESRQACKQAEALLDANAAIIPRGAAYLNSQMHDSWVLSHEKIGTDFSIEFNDFQSHCFCAALTELKGNLISHRLAVLPVKFVFEQVRQLSVSYVNRKNKLLPVKTRKFLPLLREFLCDDVQATGEDGVRLAMLCWTGRKGKSRTLVLEIEAKTLRFQEGQRSAFANLVGQEYCPWFDRYMAVREKREWYFDFSGSLEFLKAHGFPGK